MTTTQDSRRTLEEIREGDYVVGAKERRDSRTHSIRRPNSSRQQQHMSLNPASVSPIQPTLLLDIPEHGVDPGSTPISVQSAPNFSHSSQHFSPNSSQVDGLGLSCTSLESPSTLQGILKPSSSSHISLLDPHEEQNSTIRALWKAEYGRLVSMYGQAGVDRNIAELKRDGGSPKEEGHSPFIMEPLPQPGLDMRDTQHLPRSGRNSRAELQLPEGDSDESSHQRLSLISSVGYASSYTTRTSFAETDSINTRDDIRKMVDDMRSTYLKAIESREPSLQAVKSLKKRKTKTKKTKSTTGSTTPRPSTAVPPATPTNKPTTPEAPEQRSVSACNPSPPLHSQRNTRNFSSPVGGINTLPAIEASPSRDREPEPGLKRADSSTLGVLMGEQKRSTIQNRKSRRSSRRSSMQSANLPDGPSAKQLAESGGQDADEDVTVLDEDFQNLYKDIFRTSTHEFWQTQAGFSPTLGLPSTIEAPDRPPPPVPISF